MVRRGPCEGRGGQIFMGEVAEGGGGSGTTKKSGPRVRRGRGCGRLGRGREGANGEASERGRRTRRSGSRARREARGRKESAHTERGGREAEATALADCEAGAGRGFASHAPPWRGIDATPLAVPLPAPQAGGELSPRRGPPARGSPGTQPLILLDGGFGHLLKGDPALRPLLASLPPSRAFLASALALESGTGGGGRAGAALPSAVEAVHAAYLDAGADVIEASAAFECTPRALASVGRAGDAGPLAGLAARAALEARSAWRSGGGLARRRRRLDHGPSPSLSRDRARPLAAFPWVAACLPPLTQSYGSDEGASDAELLETYALLARAQALQGVDIALCETLGSSREARAAARAAWGAGLRPWVSLTVHDAVDPAKGGGRLRGSEETVEEAAEALLTLLLAPDAEPPIPGRDAATDPEPPIPGGVATPTPPPVPLAAPPALLVNCCSPEAAVEAVRRLAAWKDRTPAARTVLLGAYPNAFRVTTDEWIGGAGGGVGDAQATESAKKRGDRPREEEGEERQESGARGGEESEKELGRDGQGHGDGNPKGKAPVAGAEAIAQHQSADDPWNRDAAAAAVTAASAAYSTPASSSTSFAADAEPSPLPETIPPAEFADRLWPAVPAGAAVLGGCCGTTPDHIRELRRRVDRWNEMTRTKG